MQSIDHKGLCVKYDNVGLLGAIGYIYLVNVLDYKMRILMCVLCQDVKIHHNRSHIQGLSL